MCRQTLILFGSSSLLVGVSNQPSQWILSPARVMAFVWLYRIMASPGDARPCLWLKYVIGLIVPILPGAVNIGALPISFCKG